MRPPLPSRQLAAADVPAVAALPDEPLAGAVPGTAPQDHSARGCHVAPAIPGMSTPPLLLSPSVAPTPCRSTSCYGCITLDRGGGCRPSSFCPIRCPGGAGVSSGPSPALGLCCCQSPSLSQEGLVGSVPIRYSLQGDRAPSGCARSARSRLGPSVGWWRAPTLAGMEGQPGPPPPEGD